MPLLADFANAESDLSGAPLDEVSISNMATEFLGLSGFPLPGILDLMELRIDREDSLVSDLSNER